MYKFLVLTSLFNIGLINTSLSADTTAQATHTSSSDQTTDVKASEKGPSPSDTSEEKDDADKIGAWMIEAAQTAKDYVETLDKGNYAQSWSKGDSLFQRTISQKEWESALESMRKPLGKVKSRTLKDQRPAWDPQGLPKGPYMVVEYHTSFEKAPQSAELITLRKDPDGNWRVLTYQVN